MYKNSNMHHACAANLMNGFSNRKFRMLLDSPYIGTLEIGSRVEVEHYSFHKIGSLKNL